jgi:phosphate transport system permease protein
MTDIAASGRSASASYHRSGAAEARLRRRHAAEQRFRIYGLLAIGIAVAMLIVLLTTILSNALGAFRTTEMRLAVTLDAAQIDPSGAGDPSKFDRNAVQDLIYDALYAEFPDVAGRVQRRALRDLVSPVASVTIVPRILADPGLLGQTIDVWVPVSDPLNQLAKGLIDRGSEEARRSVKDEQVAWFDRLEGEGRVRTAWNTTFFTGSDSNYPELAGIWGAAVGTFFTMVITVGLAFPIGVASAVYLEEFAPKNRWTDLIEVNINNLAAVPSIIFGLLGLAVFLQFFGLPRSVPLVGGMVLALMSLPVMIIASRAALKSIPPSVREAALGMGASKLQSVAHHVVPLALPGMMTGMIISMAHALGETAPLLMIGMNAFITAPPDGVLSPSAVLPVQVYIWADRPERGFVELTSAAILTLLVFLIAMNSVAVWLRRKFERRW